MDAPQHSRSVDAAGANPMHLGLRRAEIAELAVLGAPSLGLSLAITTISAFLPLILRGLIQSQSIIGLIVSGEGVFALLVPVVLGALSDRVRTRVGPRLPFLLASTPVAAATLVLLPFSPSIAALVVGVAAFYLAYFAYYSPYRAMFADLVDPRLAGRAQSSQMIFREIGLGVSLVCGGFLMQWWHPLPFLISAAVLVLVTAIVYFGFRATYAARAGVVSGEAAIPPGEHRSASLIVRRLAHALAALLVEHREIRRLLVANALWEFAFSGLKTFVVLYIVVGTGRPISTASILMGVVAVVAVVAAPIAGALADRHGLARVLKAALAVYGVGLLLPLFSNSLAIIVPMLPVIGLGGGLAMSLPYGLLMRLMPRHEHGAAAGLFEFSRGLGTTLGPLVTGAVIDLLRGPLASTHGYAAMWPVVSFAILLSIPITPDERKISPVG